jgi:predicted acylesterase/phospholipase RssA
MLWRLGCERFERHMTTRSSRLRPCNVVAWGLWLLAVSLSGCASIQRPVFAPEAIAETNDAAFPGVRFPADKPPVFAGATVSGTNLDYTVLALSGGGADGAFGVGLLAGWSQSRGRPSFDVVTGVSTGALIAPFAFLGSARNEQLRELYTGPHLSKLLKQGSAIRLLRGPSIYKNTALKSEIAKYITDELLTAIADEHRGGRRLFVATSNLDAQQMVIWDLGAIAACETLASKDLFREILLAAASIPIAFDPVAVRSDIGPSEFVESHSDANIFAHFYAGDELFPVEDCKTARRKCSLYVIAHSKIVAEPETVKWKAATIGRRALQTLLKANLRAQLSATATAAKANNVAFQLAYLDVPFPSASPIKFDVAYMKRLYEIGFAQGQNAQSWSITLPPSR